MSNFFKKATDSLNKGVATVGANSKALLEKSKINSAISNLENERVQLVQLLGQNIYNMYKAENQLEVKENIVNLIGEVDKRLELIAQQQELLKLVEQELNLVTGNSNPIMGHSLTCPCGHENPGDAKFCAGCGSQTTSTTT